MLCSFALTVNNQWTRADIVLSLTILLSCVYFFPFLFTSLALCMCVCAGVFWGIPRHNQQRQAQRTHPWGGHHPAEPAHRGRWPASNDDTLCFYHTHSLTHTPTSHSWVLVSHSTYKKSLHRHTQQCLNKSHSFRRGGKENCTRTNH